MINVSDALQLLQLLPGLEPCSGYEVQPKGVQFLVDRGASFGLNKQKEQIATAVRSFRLLVGIQG